MNSTSRIARWVAATIVGIAVAPAAWATTAYTDVIGTNVSFTGIQESSSYGDPEPLFDQPIGSGNQLLFFPPNFVAQSTGGGVDATGSQLQLTMSGNSVVDTITQINITEYGDWNLSGFGGTAATGVQISMTGFLTVMEDTSGPITPVVIPISGTFAPKSLWDFPTDGPNSGLWSGGFSVDVTAYVANATVIELSLDNDMFAGSEGGTSAKIQKKVVDGPAVVIEVIPEPGTALLVGTGLAIMGLRARRRTQ